MAAYSLDLVVDSVTDSAQVLEPDLGMTFLTLETWEVEHRKYSSIYTMYTKSHCRSVFYQNW